MDFNIKKIIQKKYFIRDNKEKEIIVSLIRKYYSNITTENIHFSKRVLFLRNISPNYKTNILLYKEKIIQKSSQKGIIINTIY